MDVEVPHFDKPVRPPIVYVKSCCESPSSVHVASCQLWWFTYHRRGFEVKGLY
jgi:hypothetical protein